MELTGRVWHWLEAHRGLALGVGGAAILLLLVLTGVQRYLEHRLLGAAELFRKALVLYQDGDASAAVEAFGQVPAVAGYGPLANLYRGQAALQAVDLVTAAEAFRASAAHRDAPSYVRQEALLGAARALEQQGDRAGALEQYQAAAALAGPFQIEAQLGAARLSEATGAVEKAREYYEGALEEAYDAGGPFEEDLRTLVEWRLAKLPPKADSAAGSD